VNRIAKAPPLEEIDVSLRELFTKAENSFAEGDKRKGTLRLSGLVQRAQRPRDDKVLVYLVQRRGEDVVSQTLHPMVGLQLARLAEKERLWRQAVCLYAALGAKAGPERLDHSLRAAQLAVDYTRQLVKARMLAEEILAEPQQRPELAPAAIEVIKRMELTSSSRGASWNLPPLSSPHAEQGISLSLTPAPKQPAPEASPYEAVVTPPLTAADTAIPARSLPAPPEAASGVPPAVPDSERDPHVSRWMDVHLEPEGIALTDGQRGGTLPFEGVLGVACVLLDQQPHAPGPAYVLDFLVDRGPPKRVFRIYSGDIDMQALTAFGRPGAPALAGFMGRILRSCANAEALTDRMRMETGRFLRYQNLDAFEDAVYRSSMESA